MSGYELAEEVFKNIGKEKNHEISVDDLIRVISFWGFNEEAERTGKIGFVCYCAREKIKKIFEQALVWDNYKPLDDLYKRIKEQQGEST